MTASLGRATPPAVILASGSATRAALLRAAGVAFEIAVAAIDETEVKSSFRAAGESLAATAEALAELKARRASRRRPAALVVGADQMLECAGAWFDKPRDLAAARDQLVALAGRTHQLATAVVVVEDDARVWSHVAIASMTMRPLAPGFVDAYLAAAGAPVLAMVGGYQLEGLGVQLFSRVEGDYFGILGLPLLPLLAFLRERSVIAS